MRPRGAHVRSQDLRVGSGPRFSVANAAALATGARGARAGGAGAARAQVQGLAARWRRRWPRPGPACLRRPGFREGPPPAPPCSTALSRAYSRRPRPRSGYQALEP